MNNNTSKTFQKNLKNFFKKKISLWKWKIKLSKNFQKIDKRKKTKSNLEMNSKIKAPAFPPISSRRPRNSTRTICVDSPRP